MNKTLYFTYSNDYRSGRSISVDEYEENEESIAIDFTLPDFKMEEKIYLVEFYPRCEIIYEKMVNLIDLTKWKNKIYSMFHNHLPFITTDYTSSYKEIGYYPPITDEIRQMEDISEIQEIVDNIKGDEIYFMISIDKYCCYTEPILVLPKM